MVAPSAPAQTATLVTQTRVLPGKDAQFTTWQQAMSDVIAAFPGYLDHTVIEPSPPAQFDWVIIQRFSSLETAQAWLKSSERQRLLTEVAPLLSGQDDVHIFRGDAAPPSESVTAVISATVVPGREDDYRAWERRIAAAEATFPGFQGSKLEPPIAGVQSDWTSVVRFDSDEHLQAWLTSPQRQRLLDEAKAFSPEARVRRVRGGFEGWFDFGERKLGVAAPASWKINMVIQMVLYPVVFLYGFYVLDPFFIEKGVPFWLALFIAKVISVVLMGYWLVPPVMRALNWWLKPAAAAPRWTDARGAAIVLAVYGVCLAVFSQFP